MKIAFLELNPREIFGPTLLNSLNVELFSAKKGHHSFDTDPILTLVTELREGEAITMRSWPIPIITLKELSKFRCFGDQWNHYVILKGAQHGVYLGSLEQLNHFLLLSRSPNLESVIVIRCLVFGMASLFFILLLLLLDSLFQEFVLFLQPEIFFIEILELLYLFWAQLNRFLRFLSSYFIVGLLLLVISIRNLIIFESLPIF